MTRASSTPLMQQYREIKARHQDAILFFRMGDFYEMFYEDAETASRALGLTLTSRNNGGSSEVPLAGVPVKAAAEYLRRLVQQGFRVSICEQTEDPKLAKGIVRREVIETITPGAAYADDMLDGSRNNFLCAVHPSGDSAGIAAVDLSTGEFRLVIAPAGDVDAILSRLTPREILVARELTPTKLAQQSRGEGALITERESWEFDPELAATELTRQFGVASVEGIGISESDEPALAAAGSADALPARASAGGNPHLARPKMERPGGTMPLDEMTRRNLELVESLRGGEDGGTLIGVLDRTLTPMGSRLLRQWLLAPLTSRKAIDARLDAVAVFAADPIAREAMRSALDGVRDVERLAGKTASGRGTPREVRALGDSITRLPAVESVLKQLDERAATERVIRCRALMDQWDGCADLGDDIIGVLVERPPISHGDEPSIRTGVDAQLDEWRSLRDGGKDGIARIQMEERARTGINSLKVGYNRVFGYFIEITNSHRHLVPADYQRRQTLTGAERYVTPALKEFEEKVLNAAERIEERERELFEALRQRIGAEVGRLQCISRLIAELDVLAALAEVAERGYVRPEMTDDFALEIMAGRHPVVERMMPREKFIPNDVRLTEAARMMILTGPNMAGKSTILRQIGLIVLMAQIGSFVPASRAKIGVTDRLFTRVGASDNLVRGQSTFMVEMSETSAILHTATGTKPGAARRDRSRHLHLRRRVDRLVGERVPAR